ncbi:uncharacterized protein LOC111708715 [Eurytemora carolleeae]|uniref:uncharacterized protein LOC111708715 n=1 Tax=Eurytemora carolleeae TaxID=1294199 RepID=UPI000C781A35|nr:uncharacterized protein LOC111708715 [Eurytemora carolleeae]|eukprot:XP_023337943.1 uncharacterized protein LOC111708715 [Eurytemora affinis]
MFVLLCVYLLSITDVRTQTLTCPTTINKPDNFLVIGGSGGDSTAACENTAAATSAGLAAGMNSVELDISLSKDQVVFLWNDPNPLDPEAIGRSQGLFLNGLCRPLFKSILPARDMVYSLIKKNYIYVNSSGIEQATVIPTLAEWMDQFAANSQLERIYIDVKLVDISLADFLVNHIFDKSSALGVSSKIRLFSSDYSMTAALQTALGRKGLSISLASLYFGSSAASFHIGSVPLNPVSEAVTDCYDTAAVSRTASQAGWRGYQDIITRSVVTRNSTEGRYHSIISWKVNSVEKMAWLICAGVDGIITDEISILNSFSMKKKLGLLTCCTELTTSHCMSRIDPVVVGAGCSSQGLTWADLEVNQCPLFNLDILYSGIRLTCKRQHFCAIS